MDWLKRHQRGEDLQEPLRPRAEVSLPSPDGPDPHAAACLDEHGLNVRCGGAWQRPEGSRVRALVTLSDTPPGAPAEVLVDSTGKRVPARHFTRVGQNILGLYRGDGQVRAWWWSTSEPETGVPGP